MSIDPSATVFRRKIFSFCEVKLASLLSTAELRAFSAYMLRLIDDRTLPPMMSKHVDWIEVTRECGLEQPSAKLRRVAQYGFDAISRWLDDSDPNRLTHRASPKGKPAKQPSKRAAGRKKSGASGNSRAKPGPKPKPIEEFPEPPFEAYDDPVSFQAALQFQIDRFGEIYYHLHRAVFREGDAIEAATLASWLKGTKVPRSVGNLEILGRIERRYRLPLGYSKEKLPHQARAGAGFDVGDEISPAERRRLAWHLPDDFNSLPKEKQAEILEWVRRVIITGALTIDDSSRRQLSSATPSAFPVSHMVDRTIQLGRTGRQSLKSKAER